MLGVVSVYQCWHLRLSGAVCSAVTEAVMTDCTKLIFFFFLISVQLNSACVLRFYQIRASLKVPPRFPHKVETSLLHPGGKITEVVLIWMWFEFSSGYLHTQNDSSNQIKDTVNTWGWSWRGVSFHHCSLLASFHGKYFSALQFVEAVASVRQASSPVCLPWPVQKSVGKIGLSRDLGIFIVSRKKMQWITFKVLLFPNLAKWSAAYWIFFLLLARCSKGGLLPVRTTWIRNFAPKSSYKQHMMAAACRPL